ncbi:helicase associated domain-containing protein [Streptomyces sp. LN704]|uniref:helicase associated domain-containing protein n=1 Tax=unclassified Streptomyces TaxID=2593676 RepID=UPI003722AC57
MQQWRCRVLGIEPSDEGEKPKPRTSQAEKWAIHLAAATQFFTREGHLKVPRTYVERRRGQELCAVQPKLGYVSREPASRAAPLTPERIEQLSKAGMRRV